MRGPLDVPWRILMTEGALIFNLQGEWGRDCNEAHVSVSGKFRGSGKMSNEVIGSPVLGMDSSACCINLLIVTVHTAYKVSLVSTQSYLLKV